MYKKNKYIYKNTNCFTCNINLNVKSNMKGIFREKYFCSRKCANTRKHSEETKQKISKALKKTHDCLICKKAINISGKKFCSIECRSFHRRDGLYGMKNYRNSCKFKFNLKTYPNEFDFPLIEIYGY